MIIKRRNFIQAATLASASILLPRFLNAMNLHNKTNGGHKKLVIIQLTGGNDGLNTIIPIRNDIYYKSRPNIAINRSEALNLNDEAAINPNLPAFKELYDNGYLSIVNNIGYPNPNRSHFRSMDIWQTASDSNQHLNTGWLGRYLEQKNAKDNSLTHVIETDDILSLALKGENIQGIAFRNPRKVYSQKQENFYKHIANSNHNHDDEIPNYLYRTLGNTINSTNYIIEKKDINPSKINYPNNQFGKNLHNISSLIRSDINTSVYYLSLGSFDTHVRQNGKQKELFKQLNDGIKTFTNDLKESGHFKDVMIMTFSEFGRRVSENASAGTDHGTANNMFFISGSLKKQGILNSLPDLANLKDGDLKYQVDFRDIYATILQNWLETNITSVLGQEFKTFDFI